MKMNPIQEQLEQPETQEAIVKLLINLPTYQKNLEVLDDWVSFGKAVLEDRESLQKYDDLIRSYNLDLETVEAVIHLLEKAPQLNELVDTLYNFLEFGQTVIQDDTSMEYIEESVKSYTDPVFEKGRQGLDFVKEVQQKAKTESEPIKLFTILKWLKDPSVQDGLKHVQAALSILNKTK